MAVQDRYRTYLADQREFFDALITEDWGTYASASWDETRRYEVGQLFRLIRPKTILDVGCGCGFHDPEMAGYPFVEEIHAFDYSAQSVEKANEVYSHSKVKRWVADMACDPLTRQYDLVVSFQVFEHLSEPNAYFRFCREASAAGGHVAIFTPNRLRLQNRLRRMRGLPFDLLDPQHYKEYTVTEIAELGKVFGFELFSSFGYGVSGWSGLDRLSNRARLRLGSMVESIASGLCIVLRNSIEAESVSAAETSSGRS